MRVLMTADAVGGVWTYALEAANAMVDLGVSVTLAVMGGRLTDEQRRRAGASGVEAVHESTFALEWMEQPWEDVDCASRWLLEVADQACPDVVHLNGYAHATLPWSVPCLVVAHSDVFSWWAAVHGQAPPSGWAEYHRRVAAGLAAADALIAPSSAYLADLRRWFPVGAARVVPNGRSADWVTAAAKEPFAIGAGRLWDEAKNLRVLDAVAGRIDWPIVLAGDPAGPGGRAGRWRAAHVLGALPFDQLALLLGRAAVFAHPARYEPFGLGPLEAALAGCALVLADIPTLREVWGGAATYVDPDDDEGWTIALDGLLAHPARAAARGADARQRAQRYDPASMAQSYVDAYRALPAACGRPR